MDPKTLANPKMGSTGFALLETPRNGALFPNINVSNRVPDMLHMVCNVTKWLLKQTASIVKPQSTKKQKLRWCQQKMEPYLNKAKKLSPNATTARSAHSAYWDFVKEGSNGLGWRLLIPEINNIKEENINIFYGHRRKKQKTETFSKSESITLIWENFELIFLRACNVSPPPNNSFQIKTLIEEIKTFVCALKFKVSPWVHVFLFHFAQFEVLNPRPIFLTCHSIEGHHRLTKKDFSQSLHSTRRRGNKKSGLCDLIHRDNVVLGLLSQKIFPWEKLKMSLGSPLDNPLPRGLLYNFILNKFPPVANPYLTLGALNIPEPLESENEYEDDASLFSGEEDC